MKKILSILLGLVMVTNVIMAELGEVTNKPTAEELYLQMIPGITAAIIEKNKGVWGEKDSDKVNNQVIAQIPSSLNAFFVDNVYAVKGTSLYQLPYAENSSISYLSLLQMGENDYNRPVFEAIYNHISSLIPQPELYYTEATVEQVALVTIYIQQIELKDCEKRPYDTCVSSDFANFFKEKEVSMGKDSIKSRVAAFFKKGQPNFRYDFFTLMSAHESDYFGITFTADKSQESGFDASF